MTPAIATAAAKGIGNPVLLVGSRTGRDGIHACSVLASAEISEESLANRPAVLRLFSGLTLLWAGVHLLSAATSFGMLVSLPTTTFVALKTPVSLAITVSAIVCTVTWSIRTARREDLIFAPA